MPENTLLGVIKILTDKNFRIGVGSVGIVSGVYLLVRAGQFSRKTGAYGFERVRALNYMTVGAVILGVSSFTLLTELNFIEKPTGAFEMPTQVEEESASTRTQGVQPSQTQPDPGTDR